ncbi:MAG: hypothetical protein WC735_04565 [Candidatus Paceibacterota bacterium]|jgi:hypothetical protein
MSDGINDSLNTKILEQSPIVLTDKQKWICTHLDNLNRVAFFCSKNLPSNLFKGALYAMRSDNRINPDWMAQSAHSLREIMYGVGSPKTKKSKFLDFILSLKFLSRFKSSRREKLKFILLSYQEDKEADKIAARLNDLHTIFTNVAHHFQEKWKIEKTIKILKKFNIKIKTINDLDGSIFELLVEHLQNTWVESIPRQLKIHQTVDGILASRQTADQKKLKILLSLNEDAKRYFFAKADETWLDWLWQNNLLDAIKEKSLDGQMYRMSELNYLANVAEKLPEKVTNIILDVKSERDNFDIEVVSRFLWISSSLPGQQIARLVAKIKEENWVKLMKKFNNWGFEYEKMLEKLISIKDYTNLLTLIDVILTVRTKKEIHETSSGYTTDNPFYFNDLGQIKLFKILSEIPESYSEQALELATKKMKEIVLIADKESENNIFEVGEQFFLFDVDFYELEVDQQRHHSYRDDVRDLAAVIKKLSEKVVGGQCGNKAKATTLYEKYINSLPLSRSMWRLRLFVVSLCPQAFKAYIKEYLFKVFKYKESLELVSGAEYEQLLKKCFGVLSPPEQEDYVNQAISFFGAKNKEKYYKTHGLQVLSCIKSSLSAEKITELESVFEGKISDDYKPHPSIGPVISGSVLSRAPIDLATLRAMEVKDIANKLKRDWNPKSLHEMVACTLFFGHFCPYKSTFGGKGVIL